MNNTIVIVDCISSAVNYIEDIRRKGYEPIDLIVTPDTAFESRSNELSDLYYRLMGVVPPRRLEEKESYSQTLEMVRSLDPVLILPGGDEGISLAARLSFDLGLPGNLPENLPKMRDKMVQQNALGDFGLRHIKSITTDSAAVALDFYRRQENGIAVVKPVTGGASVGVHICGNEDELLQAMASTGVKLIQEYIGG